MRSTYWKGSMLLVLARKARDEYGSGSGQTEVLLLLDQFVFTRFGWWAGGQAGSMSHELLQFASGPIRNSSVGTGGGAELGRSEFLALFLVMS